jgi:hypothetical protein
MTTALRAALDKKKTRPRIECPEGLYLSGYEDEATRNILIAAHKLKQSQFPSFRHILPLMLQLKGKPYTLDRYFPFEPFFRTKVPKKVLLKTGRQVSKSTSLAAQGVLTANIEPYFSTLYVTPLFEMVRRFSQNYVRPFIETSPFKRLFSGSKTINSVLQRSFKNNSQMIFSFAYLDAERTRGISADKNVIDEVQDMNYDFLSVIHETMSGSEGWGLIQYAGTPKTLDNTMEHLWGDSSQAEWVVKCHHGGCGHWNVPSLANDLIAMIGPARDDVSEERPGVVCARCRRPIDPRRHGRWYHAHKERRWDFAGYHVPQIIMPMHYGNPVKWALLCGKMMGRGNTTEAVFMNEVCGESFDSGTKLVTQTDLKTACCLGWPNRADMASKQLGKYTHRVLAVDWGGNGAGSRPGEKKISFTVMTVLGMRPNGKIDVLWGYRVLRSLDFEYEARLIVAAITKFKCSHFVHDYGGAGAEREALVCQAGFPFVNIIPIRYHGAASKNIMVLKEPTADHPRAWYSVDRSRSLFTTCHCIRNGLLRFFDYDFKSSSDPGLVHDFLALQEEISDSRIGTNVHAIVRNPKMHDDFAHAVNIGCCTLWYMTDSWPDHAKASRFTIPDELLKYVHPAEQVDWDDFYLK